MTTNRSGNPGGRPPAKLDEHQEALLRAAVVALNYEHGAAEAAEAARLATVDAIQAAVDAGVSAYRVRQATGLSVTTVARRLGRPYAKNRKAKK